MSDLPRFYKGNLGPLDFQTINDVMRRLDALRPLIETAGLKQDRELLTLPDALIVYAEQTHPTEYPGRFAWNQVIIRGESTPSIPVDGEPDTIATQADDDWPDIEDNAQFRRGYVVVEEEGKGGATQEVESDSYAICLDPTFEAGYAVLFVLRRTDAKRCYLLVPIVAGDVTGGGSRVDLVMVTQYIGEYPMTGSGNETFRGEQYFCRVILPGPEGTSTLNVSSSEYELIDFGRSPSVDVNKPTVIPAGASLTARTLDAGSVVLAKRIGDSQRFVSSTITHFDVDCG